MKIMNWIGAVLATCLIISCDDSLDNMGSSMIPSDDIMTTRTEELAVTDIHSLIASDSVNAKTAVAYLGKYTDPETNTLFESDFLAQLYCKEGFEFPSTVKNLKATKVTFRMYYSSVFGDTVNACRVSIYPLNKVLKEDAKYYTNINPADYYDASQGPLGTANYSAYDNTISESEHNGDNYYNNVAVKLPTDLGTDILSKYFEVSPTNPKDSIGKKNFSNANQFINNVFKGVYVKCDKGDGTILSINQAQLEVYFEYYTKSHTGKLDSLVSAAGVFGATEEVLQANKFKTQGLEEYVKEQAEKELAIVRAPAGVFTEMTLPIASVSEKDTLNSAQLFLRHENNVSESKYPLSAPNTLLMVRKKDVYSFFDENRVYDGKTSFIATRNSDSSTNTDDNTYAFSNISNLIRICQYERNAGIKNDPNWEAKNPDWNKVVLIPVTYSTASVANSTVVTNVRHDLKMSNVRIKTTGVKLKLIYNRFNSSMKN